MRHSWTYLSESERHTFQVTLAFVHGRLKERATVEWALSLTSAQTAMRLAVLEAIDRPQNLTMGEPWCSAWRLIEECWDGQPVPESSGGAYEAQERLRAGDRSGSLAAFITQLVSPRLKIEARLSSGWHLAPPKKNPRRIDDLFLVGLTSGQTIDPGILELETIGDREFLCSLVTGLDAAVSSGLVMASRLGLGLDAHLWRLGRLYRVYWMPPADRNEAQHEPDQFGQGIAPSVKLLYEVISRLAEVDLSAALMFTRRWRLSDSPIHIRLWAAISRDNRVTPADDVASFLLSLGSDCFWDLHSYPEIAEVRAKRFAEFDPCVRRAMTARLRKGPPRSGWARKASADRVRMAQTYRALQELRRIEVAGGTLSRADRAWVRSRIGRFPDLEGMLRIDEGFLAGVKTMWIEPSPDSSYDLLQGEARLQALEEALRSERRGWDDDPARGATDWMRARGNCLNVVADLEAAQDAGAAYPEVWDRFGWTHSPKMDDAAGSDRPDLAEECSRVLALLLRLSLPTVTRAIEGISFWLSAWEKWVVAQPHGIEAWFRIWPIAVEATNAAQSAGEPIELNAVARSDQGEPMDLDTLNSPTGRLVGVFLAACPPVKPHERPFEAESPLRRMRDAIEDTTLRSRLIAQHRMAEHLNYFLRADRPWAEGYLVAALDADTPEAISLWRAIARQTRSSFVLKGIGKSMIKRTTDPALGRESRGSLVFSLVVECLYSCLDGRAPAVPYSRVQQMLRSLDDEVRRRAAEAVTQFVREVSGSSGSGSRSRPREEVFRSAARPFLQRVWPQERSLVTPEVSRALARLPVASGDAFADAVDTIERFLVPFDSWSISDYGFRRAEGAEQTLSAINTETKASALLRLLGQTIRPGGLVVPYDLADALEAIRRIAPSLTADPVFRRLATAARHG
jgi:hypothetical protein